MRWWQSSPVCVMMPTCYVTTYHVIICHSPLILLTPQRNRGPRRARLPLPLGCCESQTVDRRRKKRSGETSSTSLYYCGLQASIPNFISQAGGRGGQAGGLEGLQPRAGLEEESGSEDSQVEEVRPPNTDRGRLPPPHSPLWY